MRTILLFILFITFFACGQEKHNIEQDSTAVAISKDSVTHSSIIVYQTNRNEHPFTKSPIFIYFPDNKIYIDSIKPYFRYQNIENLETLCTKIQNDYIDSLPTAVFSNKLFIRTSKPGTIQLSEYQFLIGNLKTTESMPDILVLMDYTEAWGRELFLLSLNEDHTIKDIDFFCSKQGDGGDYYITIIKRKNNFNYKFITEHGYQTFTEPFDTNTFNKKIGNFKINNSGTFERQIIKIDSNIVQITKSDNQ